MLPLTASQSVCHTLSVRVLFISHVVSLSRSDLQMVSISLRVLSRPLASNLPTLYQHLGKDYDERVLPSIVNEVLKSVVAKFNASQLITMRSQVQEHSSESTRMVYITT